MPQLDDLSVLGGVPLGASMLGVPLGSVLGVEEGTVGSNAGDQVIMQSLVLLCLRKNVQCKLLRFITTGVC